MALGRRQPAAGRLPHSDRGSQSACQADQRLLADAGMRCSMRRKGAWLDHAVAERCFGRLKRERTAHCQYATRQAAQEDVIDYIEMLYNSTRLYSYLGYVSPNAYEAVLKAASLSVRFSLTTTLQLLCGEAVGGCVGELGQQADFSTRGCLSPFALATALKSRKHLLTQ